MLETLKELDTQLFLFLNGLHTPFLDHVMWYISERWVWIPLYLFLFYLGYRQYGTRSWIFLVAALIVVGITDQVHLHLFKNMFMRLRPTHNIEIQDLIHTVRSYRGGDFGFVSGHATNAFSVATFTAVVLGGHYRYLTPLILIWAAIVAYSRIYLGVHYPGDILGGMLLGSFFGLIFGGVTKKIIEKRE